jgi:O-antigen/teichoic acid export membrane protein
MIKILNFKDNKIFKDFFVYGLGTVLTKAIAFISLPIYTRVFLPEVYGELELFLIVGSLFAAFLNIGLDSSLSFFFKVGGNFDDKKTTTVSSIFIIITVWGLFIFLVASVILNTIDFSINQRKIYFYVLIIFFVETLISLLLNVLRLEMKSKKYTFYQVSNGLLSNVLSLSFVLAWEPTIEKLLLGRLMASAIIFPPLLFTNFNFFDFKKVGWKSIKLILLFGIPLFPAAFFNYVFNYTDRLFIQHYLNFEELGVFSAGARLSTIVSLITSSFTLAVLPHLLEAIDQKNNRFIKALQNNFFWIADLGIVLFFIFSELICFILLGENFRGVFVILGFYIIHPVYSAGYNLVSIGIWKSKKTYLSTLTMVVSCLLNIILTLFLIDFFGLIGVSISTAISSLFWIYLTAYISEKIFSTGMNQRSFLRDKLMLILSITTMTFLFSELDSKFIQYLSVSFVLLIFSLYTWKFNKKTILNLKTQINP